MSRPSTSTNESVRSSTRSMPARPPRSSTDSRCFTECSGTRLRLLRGTPDLDLVLTAVDFAEVDLDVLGAAGREVLPDVVGADRQLAVTAVDHDRELDGLRPTELEQRVERGPHRAPGEQHVVDEDRGLARDV